MARYKPIERNGIFIPVMLAEQIQPGTFEFALDHLVDHELDLSALDTRFRNDQVGASAYDPRVMLKIVLLAYSRGLISSRKIEQACLQNVLFIAISGDRAAGGCEDSSEVGYGGAVRLQMLLLSDQMNLSPAARELVCQ